MGVIKVGKHFICKKNDNFSAVYNIDNIIVFLQCAGSTEGNRSVTSNSSSSTIFVDGKRG
jgi:hypothetical protein